MMYECSHNFLTAFEKDKMLYRKLAQPSYGMITWKERENLDLLTQKESKLYCMIFSLGNGRPASRFCFVCLLAFFLNSKTMQTWLSSTL